MEDYQVYDEEDVDFDDEEIPVTTHNIVKEKCITVKELRERKKISKITRDDIERLFYNANDMEFTSKLLERLLLSYKCPDCGMYAFKLLELVKLTKKNKTISLMPHTEKCHVCQENLIIEYGVTKIPYINLKGEYAERVAPTIKNVDFNIDKIREILLSGEQKLVCPKCSTPDSIFYTKKNGKKTYNGKELQRFKCLNEKCKYTFVFEKLFDDEVDKWKALEMYFRKTWSFYKISKELGYKADTIREWIIKWLFTNHKEIYDKFVMQIKFGNN